MNALQTLADPAAIADWLRDRVSGQLQTDSRRVRAGDAFIAWPGGKVDGRQFVPQALAQGATAVLVEHEGLDRSAWVHGLTAEQATRIVAVPRLKALCGPIAAAHCGHPTKALDLIAVTGTNGKTSSTWWVAQALARLPQPQRCAVAGTLGVGVPPRVTATGLTTPDPVRLQQALAALLADGVHACAIEASSIGIAEHRLDGSRIRVAAFTNFTHDHLDYHGSMQAYWAAKRALFDWPGLQAAVLNVDDPQLARLAAELRQRHPALRLIACSTQGDHGADTLQASAIITRQHAGGYGLCFTVRAEGQSFDVHTKLIGGYNVSNWLGVLGCLLALGVPLAGAVRACEGVTPVPGRMQLAGGSGQPLVVVDYAHTPDALDKALQGLKQTIEQRQGVMWCLFGCGGDRDPAKRPAMAAIAQRGADRVVVTTDNPRSESPEAIIDQVWAGFAAQGRTTLAREVDRAHAIATAIAQAGAHDVVLIAGKGHESYQEVQGVQHPFDDMAHALAALARRRGGAA